MPPPLAPTLSSGENLRAVALEHVDGRLCLLFDCILEALDAALREIDLVANLPRRILRWQRLVRERSLLDPLHAFELCPFQLGLVPG